MKTMTISNGYVLVDDEDYDELCKYTWWISGGGYAYRDVDGRNVYMHKSLKSVPGFDTDHINGDKLDNRKCNLRPVSRGQNVAGGKKRSVKNVTSIFKGVGWFPRDKKWKAGITVNGKYIHLGYFESEEEAARAYDSALLHFFGNVSFVGFNFPNVTPQPYVDRRKWKKPESEPNFD
jgi:hypothetical protein